ncbi:sulfate permease [Flavobacteriaceae bacterium]|nr:sulfate permease [Flavobacteriaceae bacterium]MDA9886043.1 sulfate permease [Flavobacteriaceae bacterium]MDB2673208.1 sulfate permease [Flavobacteriaceae bacterium]MDB4113122.1 sulfate permease [Flavobacteriaceae bacterium]MDB4187657.1 sulfate permease [Flavobacteriaceae bacterium]
MNSIQHYFPILSWLKTYSPSFLKGDIAAGITVGIMLIPQGMAYAMIAGLPPVYGLYAALFPQIVYAIMGTSRQLAVGPVAMDSLLVAAGLGALSLTTNAEYIALASFLALFMGTIQLLLGGLKLGFLVNFLSKPVISGFTSAAAIIIALSQLNHLLGIDIPRSNKLHELFFYLIELGPQTHLLSVLISGLGISFLLIAKKHFPKLPGALLLVFLTTFIAAQNNWESLGVTLVKEVPEGLPSFVWPKAGLSQVYELFPLALTLALIAFMEAISVAKAVEEKEKTNYLNPNQELIALGSANIVGGLFQAFPTTGGFSRTAVNHDAGAKTGVAALFSAAVVGLTLLFFTSFFYHLPTAVLGAIILVAVGKLIDLSYPKKLWKNNRSEFYVLLFTFSITLFVGIKEGILLGVFAALLYMVYQNTRPHIAVLGRIKNTHYFKNIDRFSNEVTTFPHVLILRFDGQLFFGNQRYFKQQLSHLIKQHPESVNHLVLAAAPINYIDASAMEMLSLLFEELKENGTNLYWTGLSGPIRDQFHNLGVLSRFNNLFVCSSLEAALNAIEGKAPSEIEKSIATQRNNH